MAYTVSMTRPLKTKGVPCPYINEAKHVLQNQKFLTARTCSGRGPILPVLARSFIHHKPKGQVTDKI